MCIYILPEIISYFNFPYSSSDTASHHSFDVSSPGTSTAKCENHESLAAPCQCVTSGGMLMQSPYSGSVVKTQI